MNASAQCPKCNGEMVLRTARRGKNAGNQFWGCLKYPQCKGTLDFSGTDSVQKISSHPQDNVASKENTESSGVPGQHKLSEFAETSQSPGLKEKTR